MLWKEMCTATKITFNCLSLFCFINFGIDHGFSKQISFCTLCLKSLKQTIKKELMRFLDIRLVESVHMSNRANLYHHGFIQVNVMFILNITKSLQWVQT